MDPKVPSNPDRAPNPGAEFEGSRPGPKTAIFLAVIALAVMGYAYWPEIASAFSLD